MQAKKHMQYKKFYEILFPIKIGENGIDSWSGVGFVKQCFNNQSRNPKVGSEHAADENITGKFFTHRSQKVSKEVEKHKRGSRNTDTEIPEVSTPI